MVKYADLKAHPGGMSKLTLVLDVPPEEIAEAVGKIQRGKQYVLELKPYRHDKSKDQLSAIWGKIGEIASVLGASKDEIYHVMLQRYAPYNAIRIEAKDLLDVETNYSYVEVKQDRKEDGTMFVFGYKGLSKMNSAEAAVFLDGILSECKDIGISCEVKHD